MTPRYVRTSARPAKQFVDSCDNCGQPHEATYSHDSQHGQGSIFAVVCPEDHLTDYYTQERVGPKAKKPRATL